MLATARARGSGEAGDWWHKQWAAPTGETQAKLGSAAEDGSGRRRLWRALGVRTVVGAQLGPVARRDRGAGEAQATRRGEA